MKFRYTYLLMMAGVLPLAFAGCAASRADKKVTVSPVETLTPDSTSAVDVDVTINVPKHAFSRRSRLVVVPQLMQQDSLIAECRPLVLDAPVFYKKMKREKDLGGYVDTLETQARRVDNGSDLSVPYTEKVQVPASLTGGRVVAVLSTDGCGECSAVDTVDMAYIANLPTLIDPVESLHLSWMEPEFVVRPKIVEGRGEALLQFAMNRYDINLSLGRNREEMNGMLEALGKIVGDSLATLNGVSIYGMASADGSYALNDRLAKNRAGSARDWLVQNLHLSAQDARHFSVGARPEGWTPVLEAMRADGHPDTTQVAEILKKYEGQNDDVAERYIRRLACWNDIRTRYLQNDRKVVYEYTYTLKSFTTDAEMLDMYSKRPDAFNEEELLRVSTLKQTAEEKKEVYRTILHYFPQSQVAANNLAVLLLREGKSEEAGRVIEALEDYSPEALNTRAAVYIYKNDYEKAVELLETNVELPEARYNLGLVKASFRDLPAAYGLIKDYKDVNAAVLALSVNRNEEAARIMEACEDTTPRAEYVRALVKARQGDADAMMDHLAKAVAEKGLRERARTEADFMDYSTRADFRELLKGGEGL